MKNYRIIWGSS